MCRLTEHTVEVYAWAKHFDRIKFTWPYVKNCDWIVFSAQNQVQHITILINLKVLNDLWWRKKKCDCWTLMVTIETLNFDNIPNTNQLLIRIIRMYRCVVLLSVNRISEERHKAKLLIMWESEKKSEPNHSKRQQQQQKLILKTDSLLIVIIIVWPTNTQSGIHVVHLVLAALITYRWQNSDASVVYSSH